MASRILRDLKALQREQVVITGSFAPNGSSAIDATSNKGMGWSVAYSATGIYTITLEDAYKELISFTYGLALASDADVQLAAAACDVVTNKTLILHAVKTSDGVTGVAIAADAANRISFMAVVRSTDIN